MHSLMNRFRVTDPERRANREYKIAAILEKQKAEEPFDTRTAFYLARYYIDDMEGGFIIVGLNQ
jgi:hypothetical protein